MKLLLLPHGLLLPFFLYDLSHALVFGLLRLSCVNSSTCIGWDCLLACSCCWVCLPCVQLLCFLQWPVIGALRIFTLGSFRPELCFVCHTRFLCGSFIKIGCCKLGSFWPRLSPPAPTLIHRCSSIVHAPALPAWAVLSASYKNKKQLSRIGN